MNLFQQPRPCRTEAISRLTQTGGLRSVVWRKVTMLLTMALAVFSFCTPAQAGSLLNLSDLLGGDSGDYPTRSITIMAPANPGGGFDQLARLIQYSLTDQGLVAVPVEVVNRGGAGGTIGLAELITQHRGDPYSLMVGGSTLVGAVALHSSPYKVTDGVPLARLASEYSMIAVPADSPFKTLDDLMRAFRADPASISWGGGSAGSTDHLLIGMVAQAAGVDPSLVNYVAYNGGGEAATAIMAGQLDAAVSGFGEWEALAAANRIRVLAVSSPERLEGADVPTIRESGLPVDMENWRFIMAPPGISPEDREAIVSLLDVMHDSAEWQEMLVRNRWQDRFLAGPELDAFIQQDMLQTAALLAEIQLDSSSNAGPLSGPYLFPAIGLALLGFSLLGLAVGAALRRRAVAGDNAVSEANWAPFARTAGLMFAYFIALQPVGFVLATPIYFTAQARLMGSLRIWRDLAVAIGLTVAAFILFDTMLGIALP